MIIIGKGWKGGQTWKQEQQLVTESSRRRQPVGMGQFPVACYAAVL